MSIPNFLDSTAIPYTYHEKAPIVDVETGGVGIITELRAKLVTALGYTEPSTALFKCPVSTSDNNRFFDVLVTRISASTIEWRVRDQNAVTVCTRRAQIDTTTGSAIRYYCSTWGVFVEILQATPQYLSAFKLDTAPDLASDTSNYVIGHGYLTSASANDSQNGVAYYSAIDNGASAVVQRVRYRTVSTANNANVNLITSAYRMVFKDAQVQINFGGTVKWAGRIPHMLLCSSFLGFGVRRKPNIDTSSKALFQVLSLATSTITRCMMRVGEAA